MAQKFKCKTLNIKSTGRNPDKYFYNLEVGKSF